MNTNMFQDLLNSSTSGRINAPSPSQLGISSSGDLETLDKDITGLTDYVKLLISGNRKSVQKGQPEENFLNTVARDLNSLNPFTLLKSFAIGNTPQSQEITMEIIDNNNASTETHYVTMLDIQNMNPCNFKNKINPITNAKCNEKNKSNLNYPIDLLTQMYFITLMILVLYFIYKLAT